MIMESLAAFLRRSYSGCASRAASACVGRSVGAAGAAAVSMSTLIQYTFADCKRHQLTRPNTELRLNENAGTDQICNLKVCSSILQGSQSADKVIYISGGKLPLLFSSPPVTFPAAEHHRFLASTELAMTVWC